MKAALDHEYYEKARKRTRQKKRLYFHFVLFLVASTFLFILNKVLDIYPEFDWYIWTILGWLFLFILHFIHVFFMSRFFGKEWERIETEKLMLKHQAKVEKLEARLEKNGAFEELPKDSEN